MQNGLADDGSRLAAGERVKVLVITDAFPDPRDETNAVWVQRQTECNADAVDHTVVVLVRFFPPARVLLHFRRPIRMVRALSEWHRRMKLVPRRRVIGAIPVTYLSYTSPPRPWLHSTWGYFALLFAGRALRQVVRQGDFDVIHAHYATPSGTVALALARRARIPVVISVHGGDVSYTARQNRLGRRLVASALRRASAVATNSTRTSRQVEEVAGSLHRLRVVPLGGDPPPDVLPRSTARPPGGPLRLVTVGHLEPRKQHSVVLHAIAALREAGIPVSYSIVGDGPLRPMLTRLVATLGLSTVVTFHGQVPHEKIWSHLAAADVFVLPSWDEAFGVAFVEAMTMGLAVIGCKGAGGPEDLARHGECIILVEPCDPESVRQAVEDLYADPRRRLRMATFGQGVATTFYSWDACARETLVMYRELLGRRATP